MSKMMAFLGAHNFTLAANFHGGAEVFNYPWDIWKTGQHDSHADTAWWKYIGRNYVATCRQVKPSYMSDTYSSGITEGGDWYVISNGRQDYFNYYHNMREMTMELSTSKTLSTTRLDHYWQCQSHALINYIKEIHNLDDSSSVGIVAPVVNMRVYPNPTTGAVTVEGTRGTYHYDLSDRPAGVYIVNVEGRPVKVVKH
jgi:hypothetical protein